MSRNSGRTRLVAMRAVIATVALALGCAPDGGRPPVDPTRTVATISVSLADTVTEVGQFTMATARLSDPFGAPIDAADLTFTSTVPEVAVINPTDGRILGISEGTTTIIASAAGKTGSQSLTVRYPPIFINEVTPLGADDQGWVELYNPTDKSVDLAGWKVTNSDVFQTATLPAGATIPAGGFFVIDERIFPAGLPARDAIHLFSRFGVQSDAFAWGHDPETSYGRCPDGESALGITALATKGSPNVCP